jgi:hypothetical protein
MENEAPYDLLLIKSVALHADYISFWDVDVLQATLDDPTCLQRENVYGSGPQCETLAKYYNEASEAASQSCVLESDIVQEDVGILSPLEKLPGCNPVWSPTQPKATCSPQPPVPSIGRATEYYNFNEEFNPNLSPPTDIPIYVPPSTGY